MNCYICGKPATWETGFIPQPQGRVHAACYGERWREEHGHPPMKGDRNYQVQR